MAGFTLTGKDTLVVNGRVIHDFAHGDYVHITFENNLLNMKVSKDGNVLLSQVLSGQMAKVVVRLGIGSFDDQFMTALMQAWLSDAPTFSLMSGSFSKRVGDGKGGAKNVVYQLVAGSFNKIPETMASAEGTEDQGVAVYEMLFMLQNRSIQ